jgi:hypothetical protein
MVDRVEVVLLSGLQGDVFTEARQLISENFNRRHSHVTNIPYLGSRALNQHIDPTNDGTDGVILQKILWKFRDQLQH